MTRSKSEEEEKKKNKTAFLRIILKLLFDLKKKH